MAGEFFWGVMFTLIIIGLSAAGASTILSYTENSKECKSNAQCPSDMYCGSDFSCHAYPSIQTKVVYNWTPAAIIVGLCIIAAAFVFRKRH